MPKNKGIGLSGVLACEKCHKPQTETRRKFCRACGICEACHQGETHPFFEPFYWPHAVTPPRECHA